MPYSSNSAVGAGGSMSTIAAEIVTGSHVLRINGYSGTKGPCVGKSIRSSTFSIGGYSWYIAYYPDGPDERRADQIHFSLCLDDDVPAPKDKDSVKAQYKFSLLDQIGDPVSTYSQCQMHMFFTRKCLGWSFNNQLMIKRMDLESSSHLKHDSFSIRCDLTIVKDIRSVTTTVESRSATVRSTPASRRPPCQPNGRSVTFDVGDEQFVAHRNVLATRSTVFRAEFFGPMKGKIMTGVRIDDMEARVFMAMLHFIYTDTLPKMDEDGKALMAQHLLVAADRYNLERLKLICEDMLRGYIDVNIAATTLVLAEQHGYQGLKEACFRFLKPPGNLKAVMASDGFQHLKNSCPSLLEELLAMVAP